MPARGLSEGNARKFLSWRMSSVKKGGLAVKRYQPFSKVRRLQTGENDSGREKSFCSEDRVYGVLGKLLVIL